MKMFIIVGIYLYQCFCKYCKNLAEDEIHFLLICTTYKEVHQKIDILDFDNFDKNNNIKSLIDPQSFKNLKALCSFIKEVLDVRANHTAQVLV